MLMEYIRMKILKIDNKQSFFIKIKIIEDCPGIKRGEKERLKERKIITIDDE